ncbi:MAG: TlpA family protein disulfide reductase [Deltaproteobacteria bacterium]|nr:TlpA family protein disulfide reductase [Deltaproteobacteria bacterium]MCW8891983.1 TlpA family protein disulfide reductase [Deltaproteobacteria bacterium]MCW9050680.1 TlpA family protein disulfide reductase [Deltaproteobacteria bacterium]
MLFFRRLSFLIVLLLTVFLLTACNNSAQEPQPVQQGGLIGKEAPDFTLSDMQGNQVSLSQFKGKVVILNFWATWCPPCREEMPSMEKLYRDYQAKGLVMLAVNVEENGKRAVSDFLKRTPHSFPILLDSDNLAQNTYGVFRFPESFIIDRNGVVVEKIIGARDWLSGTTFKLINFLLNG